MRSFVLVLVVVGLSFAGVNHSGYGKVDTIPAFDSTLLAYGVARDLVPGGEIRFDVLANDSVVAGFAGDSIALRWGYQTGHPLINASGNRDTGWAELVVADSFVVLTDPLWGPQTLISTTAGAITTVRKVMDTTSITGWIKQSNVVTPRWDAFIRPWVQGIAGNRVGKGVPLRVVTLQEVPCRD